MLPKIEEESWIRKEKCCIFLCSKESGIPRKRCLAGTGNTVLSMAKKSELGVIAGETFAKIGALVIGRVTGHQQRPVNKTAQGETKRDSW